MHPEATQQVKENLLTFGSLAGVGLLIDRFEAHQPHQAEIYLTIAPWLIAKRRP